MTNAEFSQSLPLSERGTASPLVIAGFGFWLFLLSDIVIFAVLFAAYAVLSGETAGGPAGKELFDRTGLLVETALLLFSSYSCGLMDIESRRGNLKRVLLFAAITGALGLGFLSLEAREFGAMVAMGAGPSRSAFLSAFFTLVGTHGLHVGFGVLWLAVMAAQVLTLGLSPAVQRRLLCFSLFWHALDIVWVGVFTIVYLGAR